MRDATSFYILVRNHTEGLALYRYLREQAQPVRISPTPRAAKASCGMSLLVSPHDIVAVRKAVAESTLPIDRIIELENQINPLRDRYC